MPRKLTDDQVREIRAAGAMRKTLHSKALARRYGVSKSYIDHIIKNDRRVKP